MEQNPHDLHMKVLLVLTLTSFLFFVIAFSSGHWWESRRPVITHFRRLGLWEFCFDNYVYGLDYRGKVYDGCWYIFAKEFYWARDLMLPAWFIIFQTIMSFALIAEGLSMVFTLKLCLKHYDEFLDSDSLLKKAVWTRLTVLIMQAINLVLFPACAMSDWQWVGQRMTNDLGWSFGLAVVTEFLCGGIMLLLLYKLTEIINHQRKLEDLHEQSGLRTITSYEYQTKA